MATAQWYGAALVGQFSTTAARRVDFVTDTMKIMLVGDGYTFDQDAHDFRNDATADEIAAGGGYSTGGATLAGKSITYDNTTNRTRFWATSPTWTSATITAYGAIVYKDTGASATDPLIWYLNFGSAQTVTSGTFGVDFDATDGIAYIAAS